MEYNLPEFKEPLSSVTTNDQNGMISNLKSHNQLVTNEETKLLEGKT